MPVHLSHYLIMLAALAWVVWRRVSRSFGYQPIRRKRMIFRVAMFALLGCLLALTGLHQLALAEGLLGGVLVGSAMGLLGLRLTRFEVHPAKGDCYVPNPWIGATLSAMLLARLGWRMLVLWPQMQQDTVAATPGADFAMSSGYAASPLTMLMVGLLIGYYIVYFTGLLIHHRRFQQSRQDAAATL